MHYGIIFRYKERSKCMAVARLTPDDMLDRGRTVIASLRASRLAAVRSGKRLTAS